MTITDEIKDLLQSIIKARKNLKIYPENNPIYKKTIDDVSARFNSVFDYTDEISLKIKQFEIVYDDQVVYKNTDKDESLALFFFKDGVRELSFKKGLPLEEIRDFLKIISSDFERELLDDDVVTLMWERDFQFISYVVDENFIFDEDGQEYEFQATDQLKSSYPDEEDQIIKAYEDAFGVSKTEKINLVPLTNEDLQAIVEDIENDPPDKSYKLMVLLFEALSFVENETELNEIRSFIKKTMKYAVEHASLSTVIYALKRIKGYNDETQKKYFKDILDYINSEDIILTFGDTLEHGALYEPEEIEEFSSYLGQDAIPHLLTLLAQLQSISSRKTVINILTVLGKNNMSALAVGLRDSKWYVVRNVIYIFHQIGRKEATRYLKPLLTHPDIRVKKECIKALGDLGSPDVLKNLQDFIDAEDETLRTIAIRAIAKIGGPLARKILLDIVNQKDFRDRSYEEKKEILEALCGWKEPEIEDLMIRLFRKKSFFKKAKTNEVRAIAAYCLGKLGTKKALEVLQKNRNVKEPIIYENIQKAIKRIEDG